MFRGQIITNMFRDGVDPCFHSDSDDVAAGKRWGGGQIALTTNANGHEDPANNVEWQYIEPVDIVGGMLHVANGGYGDWCRYEVFAPSTPGVPNPGSGAFAKLGTAFVPAGTAGAGDPDWDLDLAEKLPNNTFTKIAPVPVADPTKLDGFFDLDPDTRDLVVNLDRKGAYNVLDVDQILSRYLADINIMGSGMHQLMMANVRPRPLLPHWRHRLKVNVASGGGANLMVAPVLLVARPFTYPT